MAFISSVRDHHYTVELDAHGQRRVVLDGDPLEIDWCQVAPLAASTRGQAAQGGRYTLLIEGDSYEICARRLDPEDGQEGSTYEVLLAGQRFEVQVADERARALLGVLKTLHQTGEVRVRAPMPGLVLAILKMAGETVERGETVAVLEAMKMENNLTAPRAGVVKEVLASQGQTVSQGDSLLVITDS